MEDYNRHYSNKSMEKSEIVDVSSKVMLASIIILFLIIVLVVLLHFYSKWYWSRRIGSQTTGTLRRRRFVFTPSLEQNIGIRRQGLASSVMKSLPIVTFSANEFKDGLECSVCLCEVEQGEKARVLPKCNHGFHVDCIDMWFQSHSTCPLCRNPVSVESSSPDSSQEASSVVPITAENNNNNNNNNNGVLIEAPSYPTNVMFWGNQTRVSIRDSGLEQEEEEEETSSLSSSPSDSTPSLRPDRALIIDIPQRVVSQGYSVSSPTNTPSSADMKSPVSTRFKSLCKLLSREKRVVPSSTDIEQGQVEGSSKMSPACHVIGTSTAGEERSSGVNILDCI